MEAWKLLKHQANMMWKECTICSGMKKGNFIGNYNNKGGEKHIFLFKITEQPFQHYNVFSPKYKIQNSRNTWEHF